MGRGGRALPRGSAHRPYEPSHPARDCELHDLRALQPSSYPQYSASSQCSAQRGSKKTYPIPRSPPPRPCRPHAPCRCQPEHCTHRVLCYEHYDQSAGVTDRVACHWAGSVMGRSMRRARAQAHAHARALRRAQAAEKATLVKAVKAASEPGGEELSGKDWVIEQSERNVTGAMAFAMGLVVHQGLSGFPKDAQEALKWYTKGAIIGHAPCQFNIGALLHHPDFSPCDPTDPKALWTRARRLCLTRAVGLPVFCARGSCWRRMLAAMARPTCAKRSNGGRKLPPRGVPPASAIHRTWHATRSAGRA
jgi:hypothetical protein